MWPVVVLWDGDAGESGEEAEVVGGGLGGPVALLGGVAVVLFHGEAAVFPGGAEGVVIVGGVGGEGDVREGVAHDG